MAIDNALFEFNAQNVSTTEYSLTNNSTTIATQTTDAVISVWLDCPNMVAGDEFLVALREKVTGSGTQRKVKLASLIGVQDAPFISSPFQVGNGWDVTLQRIAAAARSLIDRG
jgi:hypothetical protein